LSGFFMNQHFLFQFSNVMDQPVFGSTRILDQPAFLWSYA